MGPRCSAAEPGTRPPCHGILCWCAATAGTFAGRIRSGPRVVCCRRCRPCFLFLPDDGGELRGGVAVKAARVTYGRRARFIIEA
jgi:hypothetical protein